MKVVKEKKIGEYFSQMVFLPNNQLSLVWFAPDGKVLKTMPSKLKKEYGEALLKWKDRLKKDKKFLSNRKKEMDRLFIQKRIWDYPEFQKKFINRPLSSLYAKKLVWQIRGETEKVNVIWYNYCLYAYTNIGFNYINLHVWWG